MRFDELTITLNIIDAPLGKKLVQGKNNLINAFPTKPAGQLPYPIFQGPFGGRL